MNPTSHLTLNTRARISLLVFIGLYGWFLFTFFEVIVKVNPERLLTEGNWMFAGLVVAFSYMATMVSGRFKIILAALVILDILSVPLFFLYLQFNPLQLSATLGEFAAAGLITVPLGGIGASLGALAFKKLFGGADEPIPEEAASASKPRVRWVSYNKYQRAISQEVVNATEAKQRAERHLEMVQTRSTHKGDTVAEDLFSLKQGLDTSLRVNIRGFEDIKADLGIDRSDLPLLLSFLKGFLTCKLTLTSREELLSVIDLFYQITPSDFMPRLTEWCEHHPHAVPENFLRSIASRMN